MSEGLEVFAKVPFRYTEEKAVDRGEIFRLQGFRNDHKLVGLGYVIPLEEYTGSERDFCNCDMCGSKFINMNFMYGCKTKEGGCKAVDSKGMTREEFAELAGRDVDKIGSGVFPNDAKAQADALRAGVGN